MPIIPAMTMLQTTAMLTHIVMQFKLMGLMHIGNDNDDQTHVNIANVCHKEHDNQHDDHRMTYEGITYQYDGHVVIYDAWATQGPRETDNDHAF